MEDETYGICKTVIIQANSFKDAYERLCEIGDYVDGFDSYCPCCGERWSDWGEDDEGTEFPELYGKPIIDCTKGMFRGKAFIHHSDGRVEKIIFPEL